MVNENYLSFVEVCKKDGVYIDKKVNFKLRVRKNELWSIGRDGRSWERHYGSISQPNKKRFLLFKRK